MGTFYKACSRSEIEQLSERTSKEPSNHFLAKAREVYQIPVVETAHSIEKQDGS